MAVEAGALTRTMLESIVDRGIREIREDPKRSLRKLVDMGDLLAKGRFQKEHIRICQRMLEDEKSPYYDLTRRVAAQVDREHLKAFGISIGWDSWTVGAAKIRAQEAERGYNIPWSLTFHVDSGAGGMGEADYRRVLSEAKAKGCCAYLFFTGTRREDAELVLSLAGFQRDCAFLLFAPPEALDAAMVKVLTHRPNVLCSVDTAQPRWREAALRLREGRRLYGCHRRYKTAEDVGLVTSGAWVEELLPAAGAFAFCVADPACPPDRQDQVRRYAEAARMEQRYPVLLMDYYPDNLYIDQIISDGPCFLGALPDGTVTRWWEGAERPLGWNLKTAGLGEILSACTAK